MVAERDGRRQSRFAGDVARVADLRGMLARAMLRSFHHRDFAADRLVEAKRGRHGLGVPPGPRRGGDRRPGGRGHPHRADGPPPAGRRGGRDRRRLDRRHRRGGGRGRRRRAGRGRHPPRVRRRARARARPCGRACTSPAATSSSSATPTCPTSAPTSSPACSARCCSRRRGLGQGLLPPAPRRPRRAKGAG